MKTGWVLVWASVAVLLSCADAASDDEWEPGDGCDGSMIETEAGCIECTAARMAVRKAIDRAAEAHGVCETDDDCIMVYADTTCGTNCRRVISRHSMEKFREKVLKASNENCEDPFYYEICGHVEEKCRVGSPVCENSQCVQRVIKQ